MRSLLAFLADVADAVLGHHCRLGCGQRVFPVDITAHETTNHAGDRHV